MYVYTHIYIHTYNNKHLREPGGRRDPLRARGGGRRGAGHPISYITLVYIIV